VRRQVGPTAAAGLEAVQRSVQAGEEVVGRDLEVAKGAFEVDVRRLHQLREPVLHFDFVVAARHAQAGGALERASRRVVQLSHQ
jgi:hypothetical protein